MENLKYHKAIEEIKLHAIDYIKENDPSCYASELTNEIFNTDYYIIGRWDAEHWLIKNEGVFYNINLIKEYEEETFGENYFDRFDEPEHIVNMVVYILGSYILNQCKTIHRIGNYSRKLNEYDNPDIIKEIENI